MKKSMILLKETFTPKRPIKTLWKEFYELFSGEITELIKPYSKNIQISEDNFSISGNFQLNDGRIYYFDTQDIRNYPAISMKFYKNHRFICVWDNELDVVFIDYDEKFEENLKEKLNLTSNI